jgi:hypothetical protein
MVPVTLDPSILVCFAFATVDAYVTSIAYFVRHYSSTTSYAREIVELLTSTDLATEIHIPKRTLDQWAYLGRGPAFVKVGRYRRYRRAAVEAWLDAQTRGGNAA